MRQFATVLLSTACLLVSQPANALDTASDESEIKQAVQSYVAAFNKRDVDALVAHWAEGGVYTNRLNGEQVHGRAAIEASFRTIFQEDSKTQLSASTLSIDFVSPNVAVERGTATVTSPDAEPENTDYNAVFVRHNGKWLLDRVSENFDTHKDSHYPHLKDLEWMVGAWVDQAVGATIATEVKWTRNRNFLTRAFTIASDANVEMSGIQFVGWDAHRNQVRSWTFDSDGGVSEGTWKKDDERWIVKSTATLPDGKRASATTILRPLDSDSFGWQRIGRTVDGQILPNVDEVIIVRAPGDHGS